jgi:hypothetical protein
VTVLYAALLAISDGPTFDFGLKPFGLAVDKSFTVVNNGSQPATAMAAATSPALTAPFTFKGGTYPGSGGN